MITYSSYSCPHSDLSSVFLIIYEENMGKKQESLEVFGGVVCREKQVYWQIEELRSEKLTQVRGGHEFKTVTTDWG